MRIIIIIIIIGIIIIFFLVGELPCASKLGGAATDINVGTAYAL